MKIKPVCGCLALAVICLLLAPSPARADAGILEWTPVDKPAASGFIVVSPSEVSRIAVGSNSNIYALDSSENATKTSRIYHSTSAGADWDDITPHLEEAVASLPATEIAVAPDATGIVAVVTSNGTGVYLSTDAGDTWVDTHVPGLAGTIQAIAISRRYAAASYSQREIAIGTADWGDNTTSGQVWVFQIGAGASTWQDQGLTVDQVNPGGEVSAIAYSPSYQRDGTIIVVASTASDVASGYANRAWLCLGKRNTQAGTTNWADFSGYPVEIGTTSSLSAGDGPGVSLTASLAVPSDYLSDEDSLRELFVSYDREPDASDDVYRLDDATVTRLNAAGGAVINIASLAYSGTTDSGVLLAGQAEAIPSTQTVQVKHTADPFDTSPTWGLAATPPSGPGEARVCWDPEGDAAFCGTSTSQGPPASRDESAFSMSSDGSNWQQLSLMDTTLRLSELVPSPDSDSLFVTTYSPFGPEGIWRSANTTRGIGEYWTRQLAMETTSDRIILRMSLGYTKDYTLYAFEANGNQMAVSHDRGNSWKRRMVPDSVIDAAVADENTLYVALPGGFISKSTDGALHWGQPVHSSIGNINMLALASNGTLLVGGSNGEVAYSADSGRSFTRLDKLVGTGDVLLATDTAFADNGIIYSATAVPDSGAWRWKIGSSTDWEQIDGTLTARHAGESIGGLATDASGTLYALRREPAGADSGGLIRSLDPTIADTYAIEFDTASEALPAGASFDPMPIFGRTSPYLWISEDAGQNELWSIDTSNEVIYRFRDTLADAAPGLISPADGVMMNLDSPAGRIYGIPFTWTRPSLATAYDLEISLDPSLARLITAPVTVGPATEDTLTTIMTPDIAPLVPGTAYYWAVRATAPLRSPWSEVRGFTIEPSQATGSYLLTPNAGATIDTVSPAFSWTPMTSATAYDFQLSELPGFETTVFTERTTSPAEALPVTITLDRGHTYFWRVRAAAPVAGDWSSIGTFTIAPVMTSSTAQPQVTVTQTTISISVPTPISTVVITTPATVSPPQATSSYVWVIIGGGVALVITLIVLIYRTGR
jgi:hypothetical protein